MTELTNDERSAAARQAIEAVQKYKPFDADSIVDLMADLLHLAKRENIEPDHVILTARMHFEAEVEEEAGGYGNEESKTDR